MPNACDKNVRLNVFVDLKIIFTASVHDFKKKGEKNTLFFNALAPKVTLAVFFFNTNYNSVVLKKGKKTKICNSSYKHSHF